MPKSNALTIAKKNDDVIDGSTGEVVSNGIKLSEAEILAKLNKKPDLKPKEPDFWSPTKDKDAPKTIEGVYVGNATVGKRIEHAIAIKSKKKDRTHIMRFNGSAQLTSDLSQIDPGTYVRITYNGKVPTTYQDKDGNDTVGERNDFTVEHEVEPVDA